ncbi:Bug family tripartite tricarboxylate transporter substrate binding protein [Muricoccus aerilatus]|uniref:Bug family tripartite tricarboxylate transporter substrate binding protein n=1 Tax=Muricoccus aerilatus TaxID=452982 RepID=UPI0005C1C6BD|nr:tripartite tricarboxylate transporter substrate binding protein [Roseomonas aerilata]
MPTRRHLLRLAPALPALALARPAVAAFPDRPIRIVVPFAAGGNGDLMARLAGPRMSERLGQPVVVENRAGAGGSAGAEVVARSRPDGYNLLWGAGGPMVNSPLLMLNPRYDPLRDFASIGLMSLMPMVLVVRANLPARNLAELVELSKKGPGITVGTSGVGGANHVPLELFKAATGANLVHVPYRGGGAAAPDLVAGNVDGLLTEFSTVLDLHREGQARILAITSAHRAPLVPEAQTFVEFGLRDFVFYTFSGLWAPAGTPEEVITRLQAALAAATNDPAVTERLAALGAEPASPQQQTPAGTADFLRNEITRSRRAIELAGIKPE